MLKVAAMGLLSTLAAGAILVGILTRKPEAICADCRADGFAAYKSCGLCTTCTATADKCCCLHADGGCKCENPTRNALR